MNQPTLLPSLSAPLAAQGPGQPTQAPAAPLLTPSEREEINMRALRGQLTREDTRRFIESIRAGFLALPAAKTAKAKATDPKPGVEVKKVVDYF